MIVSKSGLRTLRSLHDTTRPSATTCANRVAYGDRSTFFGELLLLSNYSFYPVQLFCYRRRFIFNAGSVQQAVSWRRISSTSRTPADSRI
jgi:hypothetical protein